MKMKVKEEMKSVVDSFNKGLDNLIERLEKNLADNNDVSEQRKNEEELKDSYADERSRMESLTDEELNKEIRDLELKINFN